MKNKTQEKKPSAAKAGKNLDTNNNPKKTQEPANVETVASANVEGMPDIRKAAAKQTQQEFKPTSAKLQEQPLAPWRQEPEWDGRKLFIAFPSYKMTNPVTAWCLMAMGLDIGKEKVRPDMELGDAMIYHSRNALAHRFLRFTEAEWLLFVDDDMVLPIGRPEWFKMMCNLPADFNEQAAALHTPHRLTSHGKTIIGATYFQRNAKGQPVNSLRQDSEYKRAVQNFEDKIMEVDWVGTGCLLVHRKVFEDIMVKFPELEGGLEAIPFNFFQPEDGITGEDVAFCHRAKAAGHEVYVDCALQAQHVGFCCYGAHNTAWSRE